MHVHNGMGNQLMIKMLISVVIRCQIFLIEEATSKLSRYLFIAFFGDLLVVAINYFQANIALSIPSCILYQHFADI